MSTVAPHHSTRVLKPAHALIFGALTVGLLDLIDAFIFFGFLGVQPIQILHAIASGILGRSAFDGGIYTATLGTFLHFFNAFLIVTIYFLASRRVKALVRQPMLYGPLYGVVAYLVMNFVVVPLSAAASGMPSMPVFINGVLIHVLGVGIPSALFARAASHPVEIPEVRSSPFTRTGSGAIPQEEPDADVTNP